jgi:hypothetical protein
LARQVGAHCCPAHIRQVGAGSTLEEVLPLVHFRYTFSSRLPDPDRLTVPARPGVVEAASRPSPHLQGRAASSFTGLLRQAGEAGLAPDPGYMAPRGAPFPHGTGRARAGRRAARPRGRPAQPDTARQGRVRRSRPRPATSALGRQPRPEDLLGASLDDIQRHAPGQVHDHGHEPAPTAKRTPATVHDLLIDPDRQTRPTLNGVDPLGGEACPGLVAHRPLNGLPPDPEVTRDRSHRPTLFTDLAGRLGACPGGEHRPRRQLGMVLAPRGPAVGSAQRQIRLTHTSRVALPADGRSRRWTVTRPLDSARCPQPSHTPVRGGESTSRWRSSASSHTSCRRRPTMPSSVAGDDADNNDDVRLFMRMALRTR